MKATNACLAAAIKTSHLLGDFLDLVVRDQDRTSNETLSRRLWAEYIEDCRSRDPEMPQWSESTITRLCSTVFSIAAEAGYIDSSATRKLQGVHILKRALQYIEHQH